MCENPCAFVNEHTSLAWEIRKTDTSLELLVIESINTLRNLVEALSKDSVGKL